MNPAQFRLQRVSKYFEGDHIILRDVSCTFDQGCSYAITGPSGAGKSTLLQLLAGFLAPTSGTIFFNERDCATFTARQKSSFLHTAIGFVFQQPHLLPELSVIENVMMKGLIAADAYNECFRQAEQLLKDVGLHEKKDASPLTLSGGQQQRVALARALYGTPPFLLLDEPTAHLDVETACLLIERIIFLQKQYGIGIIVCTHDQRLITRMDIEIAIDQQTLINNAPRAHKEMVCNAEV